MGETGCTTAGKQIVSLIRSPQQGNAIMKCAISAVLLVAFTAPLLAGSSTTTPLGGEIATALSEYYRATEYYVVRDPSTKQCSVTSAKPTSATTTIVVGNTTYKTWQEAQAAVSTVCK